jgi:hypothetical protein
MTKIRPAPSDPSGEGRDPEGEAGPQDVCELFLAELRARRERLKELLSLIELEAMREVDARRRPGHHCLGARSQTGA